MKNETQGPQPDIYDKRTGEMTAYIAGTLSTEQTAAAVTVTEESPEN